MSGGRSDAQWAEAYAYPPPADDRSPWVRANMVASADGAATADGRTRGISGHADHRLLLVLRTLADLVLVGAGTVRAEGYGPARVRAEHRDLRAAAVGSPDPPPIAVVSASLDLDLRSRLFAQAWARTVLITCARAAPERRRAAEQVAEVIVAGDGQVDLAEALAELTRRGHRRILTEGGPRLLTHLTSAGLVDELCLTVSPLLTGGAAQRVLGPDDLDGVHLQLAHVLTEDGYLFVRYTVARRAGHEPAGARD